MDNKKKYHNHPVIERLRNWLMYDGDPNRPSAPKVMEEDLKTWERLQFLRTLLTQKALSYHDCLPIMCKTFDINENKYWADVRGLCSLVGDLEANNRDMERVRLKELSLKAFQMAAKKEDSKGMSAAVANLIKLNGFDRDEPEKIDPEKLNPGMYALVMEEDVRQLFYNALTQTGSLDMSRLLQNVSEAAETIPYEQIEIQNKGATD